MNSAGTCFIIRCPCSMVLRIAAHLVVAVLLNVIRNFSGTGKRPTKPLQPCCLALKWLLFHVDGGASDQSESIAADCRITGFFGKKAASKKLLPETAFCFSQLRPPRPWFDEANRSAKRVPKNNGLLSIAKSPWDGHFPVHNFLYA